MRVAHQPPTSAAKFTATYRRQSHVAALGLRKEKDRL